MIDPHVKGHLVEDDASRHLDDLHQQTRRRSLFRNGLPKWIFNFKIDDAVAVMAKSHDVTPSN